MNVFIVIFGGEIYVDNRYDLIFDNFLGEFVYIMFF